MRAPIPLGGGSRVRDRGRDLANRWEVRALALVGPKLPRRLRFRRRARAGAAISAASRSISSRSSYSNYFTVY